MKKWKAILALVLVAALFCTLFAACAKSEENTNTTPSTSDTTPAKSDETPAESEEPASSEPETYEPEDYTDIVMYYFDLRMCGAENGQHIEDAINEYIGPKYGLQVDLTWFVIGDWLTKIQLAIGSGERVDVLPLEAGNGVATLYANTMVMDITDYMAEYAPETMELMADYVDAYKFGGRLYGIPTLRGYVTNQYIIMRKDILEELGLLEKAENMSSWSEFEEILAAVADAYKGTGMFAIGNGTSKGYGLPNGGGVIAYEKFEDADIYDYMGDSLSQAYTDREGHVSWVKEQPQVEENYKRVATWLKNGWAYPDSALDETHGDELMKQNVQFSTLQQSEYGVEAVKSANCGFPLVAVQNAPGMIMTATLTSWGIGVPITADEPEGACKMINILYTDEYVMNLITRGQEGVDYDLVDGECVYTKEPGSFYYEADFLIGNNLLTHPVEGQGADYFEQIKAINEAATVSPYLGFVFDTTGLDLTIANITAVNDQFNADLSGGNYTPEMFAEAKAKYETAGVRDYLDEIQKQLDAWMAQ